MIKLLRGLCFGISLRPPLTPPSADGENANAQAAAVACAPATGDVEYGISKYKLQKTINLAPNKSQQSNFNNQTTPWFELWNLGFIWDLGFGIWNFSRSSKNQ
ncbi:MAG: hypothetical protein EOM83_08940 [Clostridia bacterium]|nr:hypothetical protein [Clostridia bacterium]